jgi:DNA-binding Lrp family transcriptional regulator
MNDIAFLPFHSPSGPYKETEEDKKTNITLSLPSTFGWAKDEEEYYKGEAYIVKINPTQTIRDLKVRLCDSSFIPCICELATLTHRRELEDEEIISTCSLLNNSRIDLFIAVPFRLEIRVFYGRQGSRYWFSGIIKYTIRTTKGSTIRDLKAEVARAREVEEIHEIRRKWHLPAFPDDATVGECGIKDLDILGAYIFSS